MKSLKLWLIYTTRSFQQVLYNRLMVVIFMSAKIIRIAIFLFFLQYIFSGTQTLGGYSREQIIFFYISFNLVDTLGQFFFREVYRFRALILSGNFDFVLTKPQLPLVRILLGGADVMDLFMLVLLTGLTTWYGLVFITTDPLRWLGYISFILISLIVSASLHIFVLGLGIITYSIDHLIMIYRDLTAMARIPTDLYISPLRLIITYLVPLTLMMTLPPKILLNLATPLSMFVSLLVAMIFLITSLLFWKYSLRHYQSTGS